MKPYTELPPVVHLLDNVLPTQMISEKIASFSKVETLLLYQYDIKPLLTRDTTGSPVLCALPNLKHLSLCNCGVTDMDVALITEVVTTKHLEYLCLSYNQGIGVTGGDLLAQCIGSDGCSLKALSVRGCNIPYEACNTLYQAASNTTTLQILDMKGNNLTGTDT